MKSDNLKDGETYIIDKGYSNSGEVILVRHGKHFCTVRDPETKTEWETMTYRLSEVKQSLGEE
jgi:endonuclease III